MFFLSGRLFLFLRGKTCGTGGAKSKSVFSASLLFPFFAASRARKPLNSRSSGLCKSEGGPPFFFCSSPVEGERINSGKWGEFSPFHCSPPPSPLRPPFKPVDERLPLTSSGGLKCKGEAAAERGIFCALHFSRAQRVKNCAARSPRRFLSR